VDELYDALLARPLTWISKNVFLDLGDRALIDGTLDGMARLARRTAGVLARGADGPAPALPAARSRGRRRQPLVDIACLTPGS
jgi:hypothetical protein